MRKQTTHHLALVTVMRPAAALNLPAADAKLNAIDTEAAGPEASSLTGSNSTAQAVGVGAKTDGAVSSPPNNRPHSVHFLS